MRRTSALSAAVGVVAAVVLQGQTAQQPARPAADPTYVQWPLPASGKAYAAIDGKRLWQYVKQQTDIAVRYRDQGHPQFWGRIAGTSGDVEAAQWLLEKYRQIGLTEAHIQDVLFFHPQWAPKSWTVTAAWGTT